MKTLRILTSVLLLIGVTACGSAAPNEAYYQPSIETFDFNFKEETSFQKYTEENTAYVKRHRVYFDSGNTDVELSRITPYELPVPPGCDTKPSRGALLVHGISDTTHSLKDIAEFLNSECVLIRAMLLPGHGTRPGDLLQITKEKWIEAVDFGIRSLKNEVDHVYVVGFSLGGLLATHAATNHTDLSGLVLLSPSLHVVYSPLVWQTRWLRYVRDWVDIDPNASPVRYHSMPTNGLAELMELRSKTISSLRREKGLKPPVFAMLAEHDVSVNSRKTLEVLHAASSHEKSKFIYYGNRDKSRIEDNRTEYRNAYLPDLKILNFSHVAFPYSPENPLFGENGEIKECGENIGVIDKEEAEACLEADHPWKGELGSTNDAKYLPLQRLTYNPDFTRMTSDILSFINLQ